MFEFSTESNSSEVRQQLSFYNHEISCSVSDSPRLGEAQETFAQVVIAANDNPNGVLELDPESISVAENHSGPILHVVRSAGSFGQVSNTRHFAGPAICVCHSSHTSHHSTFPLQVTVHFEVQDISTTLGFDYSVTSSQVTLLQGETTKPVPLDIIDDITPELAETFTVRLLNQIQGGAVLGDVIKSVVTINASDNPHGKFGEHKQQFSLEHQNTYSKRSHHQNACALLPADLKGDINLQFFQKKLQLYFRV